MSQQVPFSTEYDSLAAPLVVTPTLDGEVLTIVIGGELDVGTVDVCLGWIDGCRLDGETKVVVDLQGLTFIDSAGLRALVTLQDRLSQQGPRVEFINPSPAVTRVSEICGVALDGELGLG